MTHLHHMGITISDTDETVRFFSEITDVTVTGPLVKRGPGVDATVGVAGAEVWITFIEFPQGTAVIELAEYRDSTDAPLDPVNSLVGAAHPALVVADIEAALARLDAIGYSATADPQTATSGPIEGYRYAYVVGPDRVRVELLEAPHYP